MLLRGFVSPDDYARFLERDREEAEALYRDVLINVTSFFRDPEVFDELKEQVFPAIVGAKAESAPIRVWVPGCSTGQEAYSLAMVLLEYLDGRQRQARRCRSSPPTSATRRRSKRRAPASIRRASRPRSRPERLRRFFVREERGYRIQKAVRDLCVFARQNVTVDPPFSRVDLISCRNVLIYMSPVLQERLLPVFHFALNSGGFLVLGQAETVGPFADLFELADRTHKIYRRKESAQPAAADVPGRRMAGRHAGQTTRAVRPAAARPAPRSRSPGAGPLRPAERPGQRRLRDPAVQGPHRAVSRDALRAPRPPTSFAWPRKGCSWSCAVP